jgi:hypothetical protein
MCVQHTAGTVQVAVAVQTLTTRGSKLNTTKPKMTGPTRWVEILRRLEEARVSSSLVTTAVTTPWLDLQGKHASTYLFA